MVPVKDSEFYPLCEHHLLPFQGRAHIASIPDVRIVGLSELSRLLETDTLENTLGPSRAAIRIEAAHFCLMMIGLEDLDPRTVASSYRDEFRTSHALRRGFLADVMDPRPLR